MPSRANNSSSSRADGNMGFSPSEVAITCQRETLVVEGGRRMGGMERRQRAPALFHPRRPQSEKPTPFRIPCDHAIVGIAIQVRPV